MARIFISYKRADKDIVFPLKDKIEAATGENCWMDLDGIESGEQFAEVIIKNIDAADIVLFMYSHHHKEITDYENDWTVREINYAKEEKKCIVFINLDKTPFNGWFKFMFPQKQVVDATSSSAINRLIEDIKVWLKVEEPTGSLSHSSVNELDNIPRTKYLDFSAFLLDLTAYLAGRGSSNETEIHIPSIFEHNGHKYDVVGIEENAFRGDEQIISVIIPSSVEEIGPWAFSNCPCLETVTISEGVKRIKEGAFNRCPSLKHVILPDSVDFVGDGAFYNCRKLQSIEIPDTPPKGTNWTHLSQIYQIIRRKKVRESTLREYLRLPGNTNQRGKMVAYGGGAIMLLCIFACVWLGYVIHWRNPSAIYPFLDFLSQSLEGTLL